MGSNATKYLKECSSSDGVSGSVCNVFFLVFSCILIKSSCIDVIWTLFLVLSSSQRRPLPPILAPSLYRCISNSFRISGISRCRYRLLYFIFSACNRLRSIQCKCTEPNVCNSFRNFKFGFGVCACVCVLRARAIYIFLLIAGWLAEWWLKIYFILI